MLLIPSMFRRALAVFLLLSVAFCAGCGNQKKPRSSNAGEPETETEQETTSNSEPEAKQGEEVDPDDVWYPEPLKVAGEQTALATPGSAGPAPATAAPMPATPTATETTAAAPAAGGWDSLITADIIQSEIKQIRIAMKDGLATSGKYNSVYKTAIPRNMSVLAGMAEIVAEQSMDVSWKANAHFIRDMAADVQAKANGLGNEPFEATQRAWEELDAFFDGNKPAKLPESAPKMPFSEVTKRGPAMKRMEIAFDALKGTVGSADALKKEQEKAAHEAAMLATFSRIIGLEGYDSADDEEYKGYVQGLEKANAELLASVKSGDFAAFSDALSRANKSCGECHTNFKP